jgi:hypothetical protein
MSLQSIAGSSIESALRSVGLPVRPEASDAKVAEALPAASAVTKGEPSPLSSPEIRTLSLGCLEQVEFRPVELSHAETFRAALREYPHRTSEMTFANFYGWAPIQYPRWGEFEGHLLVSFDPGNTGRNDRFLPPIGPDPIRTMAKLVGQGAQFCRVDADLALRLPQGISVQLREADHDYLYTPTQVARLEGNQSSENRRRLRRFNEEYGSRVAVVEISERNVGLAEQVVDLWLAARLEVARSEEDRNGRIEDATGCRRMLAAWGAFPELKGVIVLLDNKPVSIGVAEILRRDSSGGRTLVSHYEKCDLSIKGLPIFNFQQLCAGLSETDLINRMQDTGAPGLREWKNSWGPAGQIKKATVGAHPYLGTLIPEPVLYGYPADHTGYLRT